jgi:hypothetical protein
LRLRLQSSGTEWFFEPAAAPGGKGKAGDGEAGSDHPRWKGEAKLAKPYEFRPSQTRVDRLIILAKIAHSRQDSLRMIGIAALHNAENFRFDIFKQALAAGKQHHGQQRH